MSSSTVAGERGLRAPLPSILVRALVIGIAILLVACGGPAGSDAPGSSVAAEVSSAAGGTPDPDGPTPSGFGSSQPERSTDPERLGRADLDTAPYPVDDALAAEGGAAVASMLRALAVDPAEVDLTLSVAPGGDPTISDWRLSGPSAEAILEAWTASAPGTWSSTTLGGVPALAGDGPDGSSAWAVAADGRFVYIRSDDETTAAEIASVIGR